jgi:toxin ParE1/3/4
VNLFIRESAQEDIVSQFEWYAERGLAKIARRFRAATFDAIDALVAMPHAGTPRRSGNLRLVGLRSWPIKGFDELNVYYLAGPDLLTVIRVLHDKRNIAVILDDQELEER